MKRFVILNTRRTGSNWLCTLLDSHPEILCHHEVFNDDGVYLALDRRSTELARVSVAERDHDPLGFLDRLWDSSRDWSFVGFKMTGDVNKTVLEAILADADVRKIVLRRRSRLRGYISEKMATSLGEWEVYRQADRKPERPPVRFEWSEWMANIAAADRFYERVESALRSSGQSAIDALYENLADPSEHHRILAALGVGGPNRPLVARSIKLNPEPLRDLVSNYAELESRLRGTSLEWELTDDESSLR